MSKQKKQRRHIPKRQRRDIPDSIITFSSRMSYGYNRYSFDVLCTTLECGFIAYTFSFLSSGLTSYLNDRIVDIESGNRIFDIESGKLRPSKYVKLP